MFSGAVLPLIGRRPPWMSSGIGLAQNCPRAIQPVPQRAMNNPSFQVYGNLYSSLVAEEVHQPSSERNSFCMLCSDQGAGCLGRRVVCGSEKGGTVGSFGRGSSSQCNFCLELRICGRVGMLNELNLL